ncbi:aurora kinase A- and ninein-interacting protein [Elgaria multicarinata webbii]|uniref:aurora kinase A- and ninein-interacting protein n=1 Tax=Elgaria multicarinata webbii TaxID=159646 RepID=UPI002FCCEFBF
MKRKSRSPAEKQHETCDVWLDTSSLKRRKLQNLIGKPGLRVANRLSYSTPTKVSLPFTKQTTISTFFSVQQAEEKKTNTHKRLLTVASNSASNLKDHELPSREKAPLPASSQPLDLEEWSQQKTQGVCLPPWCSAPTQAQSNSCILPDTKGKVSVAERGDPLSLDLIQHLEQKRVLDHAAISYSPLIEQNGGRKRETNTTLFPLDSQHLQIVSSRRTKAQRKHRCPSSNSENIDPQLEKSITKMKTLKSFNITASGLCLKTNDAISNSDEGHETSHVDVASLLFTQDSEGHKVISNCFFRGQGEPSLQKKPLRHKSSTVSSPSYTECSGACYSAERGPHIDPGMRLSVLTDVSQKSCYDLLFTEDSEGNRVIKH